MCRQSPLMPCPASSSPVQLSLPPFWCCCCFWCTAAFLILAYAGAQPGVSAGLSFGKLPDQLKTKVILRRGEFGWGCLLCEISRHVRGRIDEEAGDLISNQTRRWTWPRIGSSCMNQIQVEEHVCKYILPAQPALTRNTFLIVILVFILKNVTFFGHDDMTLTKSLFKGFQTWKIWQEPNKGRFGQFCKKIFPFGWRMASQDRFE